MTLNETAARWACGVRFEDLPASAVLATRLRVLDIVGCMIAGARSPESRAAFASSLDTFPGQDGATVGFGDGLSLVGAALVNGTSALVLEFDDSHFGSAAHLGSPVISAALPMAMRQRLDGRSLIVAVAVGLEMACQLGNVAPGRFTPLGFHSTGIFGTFGAIAALAKGFGLGVAATIDATGIGGSLCAASMASWEDGTAVKSLHAGLAAMSAFTAVSLARHGITGPSVLFDGRFGFFKAHVQDAGGVFPFAEIGAGLGKAWELETIAPKAYPCGHYIQPHVQATLAIMAAHRFEAGDVERVICSLPAHVVPMVGSPVDEKRRPNTPFHGRMSLQHTIAETLLAGTLDRRSFQPGNLRDARFNALADRTVFEVDAAATDRRVLGGRVAIHLADGRRLSHTVTHARGMPQNPMTEDDLVAKFRLNAEGLVPPDEIDPLVDGLLTLDRAEDVDALFRPLCSAAQGRIEHA